ncbi:hypothetical protein VTN96DRAFT_633 [Rasamsonia emersonii]
MTVSPLSDPDVEKALSQINPSQQHSLHDNVDKKDQLARIYRKIDIRILPMVALIYLLCYLDRSNIGNAEVLNSNTNDDLLHATGLTEYQYRVALMLFLVAYSLLEAPSNLAMKVFSPPIWLAFLVASFGALCAGLGGAQNPQTVMALRFLLGMAEAGVFPGMIFYLSFCATLAGAIAYGVGHMNDAGRLQAWRWLFILEGCPCIVCAVLILLVLPRYPETATWLSSEEKEILLASFGENVSKGHDHLNWTDAKDTLMQARLWVHYFTYLLLGIGVSSLSLFAPTIVQDLGYSGLDAQLFTIPPYACAYVFTLVLALLSDRYACRGPIIAGCFVFGGVAFTIAASIPSPSLHLRYAMLVLATCSVFGGLPPLCAWVSDNVRTTTAASLASGLNIAFTGPGQIIGVWIYRNDQAPRFQLGHAVNAVSLFVGAAMATGLWLRYRWLNMRMGVGMGVERWVA